MSIHLNADTSTTWHGAQVFYDNVLSENENIAKYIQESLIKNLNTKREYKQITGQYMYKRIKVPGVLVEAGFITNGNERYLLKQSDYQIKLSKSITDGIINYFTK